LEIASGLDASLLAERELTPRGDAGGVRLIDVPLVPAPLTIATEPPVPLRPSPPPPSPPPPSGIVTTTLTTDTEAATAEAGISSVPKGCRDAFKRSRKCATSSGRRPRPCVRLEAHHISASPTVDAQNVG
jgi:hypothetical protein